MIIPDWPTQERPREKLLAFGAENLSNAELLAILINCGIHGKTALDLARELLNQFQSLRKIFTVDFNTFSKNPGMGLTKYAQIQASLELVKRYFNETIEKDNLNIISQPEDVKKFLLAKLRDHEQEVFACLFLNSKHKIIRFEKMFHGSINSANVYPREIVKRALQHNAAAIIVAHNHPSGDTEPSQADKQLTEQLDQTLTLVDIRLLDHFVIGDNKVLSFAEYGFL